MQQRTARLAVQIALLVSIGIQLVAAGRSRSVPHLRSRQRLASKATLQSSVHHRHLSPDLQQQLAQAFKARRLQHTSSQPALTSLLTVGGGNNSAAAHVPASGARASTQPRLPQDLAHAVDQAQDFNLEGEAPGNDPLYILDVSDARDLPNRNVDRSFR